MTNGIRDSARWQAVDYPVILKGAGNDTMIAKNNMIGDMKARASIGIGHEVTGVRAQIVNYLSKLRDYYIRENL